jgi:hypothetical protein
MRRASQEGDTPADDTFCRMARAAMAQRPAYAKKFSGGYAHRLLRDINVPQGAPQAFAQAVVDVGRL